MALCSRFFWTTLSSDVSAFISRCHHCIINVNGTVVPRPFGEAIHSNSPNAVIHFDYLSIGLADNGFQYLFVIRDDLSGYVDLYPCTSADHANAIDALLDWFSRFGVALVWVSDQGTHFKNHIIDSLRFRLQAQHHFVLAYTPWANGTVEVINRSILSVFRRMISEFRLEFRDWPYLVPIIRYVLNHTVTDSRPIAPVTAFTGLHPSSPLDAIRIPRLDSLVPTPISSAELHSRIDSLRESLNSIHRSIVSNRNRRRDYSNCNRQSLPNFITGDFVIVAVPVSANTSYRHKLQVRWTGPFRIVDCLSDYVYLVEDLITGERKESHVQRLRFYADSSLNVTEELYAQIAHDNAGFEIEDFIDFRFDDTTQSWQILVRWRGFSAHEDIWEPVQSMLSQVPVLIRRRAKALWSTRPDAQPLLAVLKEGSDDSA
jgi:transposase InsO family protein